MATNKEPAAAAGAHTTYYVDCAAGSDTATGTGTATAWRSVTRTNKATLLPGDSLLLKRGCTWNGQRLMAKWIGTQAEPIVIGAYGTDTALPLIRNGGNYDIKISGRWQIVEHMQTGFDPTSMDPCGQPLGQYYGVVFSDGGTDNVLQYSIVKQATAGVHLAATSSGNKVLYNLIAENTVMQTPFNGIADLGAWGVLVHSDRNEIAFNTIRDNRAVCEKASNGIASNSVELYEASNNYIHHNRAINDRVFTELGGSSAKRSADNYFAYNLLISNVPSARFITTRGAGSEWGPVYRTTLERNTVYFTGAGSEGISCGNGCTPNILTARYNIFYTVQKAIFFDGTMVQESNLAWGPNGMVHVQDGGRLREVPQSTTPELIVADPGFVNPASGNFRLRKWSPALDKAPAMRAGTDMQRRSSHVGSAADLGVFELQD